MSTSLPPYIVQELPDISEVLNEPLKCTQRIKYTCFDVSKTFIAFGATSGGLYIFNRHPCEFIQLIPSKDGPITRICISPDEKQIAFANGHGILTVVQCDQSSPSHQNTVCSKQHQGNEVSAMIWGFNVLFIGDDVGNVSILQLSSFMKKPLFQSSSEIIMTLDSRIGQLDLRDYYLLVSTLTRCYICDTSKEQYRQIGQKLRDSEFGACFVTTKTIGNDSMQNSINLTEIKKYSIVESEQQFGASEYYRNTLIFSARPSSRLWEATIDGAVRRTHQFKPVLARGSYQIVTQNSYNNENVSLHITPPQGNDSHSCSFPKIFNLNRTIFSFKKEALYFLNTTNVEHTIWVDMYKDIVDCKLYKDTVYIWLQDGSLASLRYMVIEKFILKCFLDTKYTLCAELCALFTNHLLSNECLSNNLTILVGLREKLINNLEILSKISPVLERFENMKVNDATQPKSGIVIVDNMFYAQNILDQDRTDDVHTSKATNAFESMQVLKDFRTTVTDKINNGTKTIKEKIFNLDDKTKNISLDKDIVYKETSQITLNDNDNKEVKSNEQKCKFLYQQYKLSVTSKAVDKLNLIAILNNFCCDIKEIYELMKSLEQYCQSIDAFEDSKHVPSSIFLDYIKESKEPSNILEKIINQDELYKYFVDSCISINMKTQKLSNLGCECGFPLPYIRTNKIPVYSELIDEFIERQWSSHTKERCYEVCRKMPYLWRKILYLRKNEDLMNILRLLLQMLDEELLHTFLPQFTIDIWECAIQLYSTLHGNVCLNCSKKFDNVRVKDTLSWDYLGSLIIKSVGAKNAVKVIEKYADLIGTGDMTMKFYHTAILVGLFEKYDCTVRVQLTDTLYSAYGVEEAKFAICNILRDAKDGVLKNTSLPLIVAAHSRHWGLKPLITDSNLDEDDETSGTNMKILSLQEIFDNFTIIANGVADCSLCGLQFASEVLLREGGVWVFKCGHIFHGVCLDLIKVKLCPTCVTK